MYRLKKIQEKKKINKQKAEALKKAKGITNGENIYNNSQNTSCLVSFGATGYRHHTNSLFTKFTQKTNITDRSELANHDQPLLESYSQ